MKTEERVISLSESLLSDFSKKMSYKWRIRMAKANANANCMNNMMILYQIQFNDLSSENVVIYKREKKVNFREFKNKKPYRRFKKKTKN